MTNRPSSERRIIANGRSRRGWARAGAAGATAALIVLGAGSGTARAADPGTDPSGYEFPAMPSYPDAEQWAPASTADWSDPGARARERAWARAAQARERGLRRGQDARERAAERAERARQRPRPTVPVAARTSSEGPNLLNDGRDNVGVANLGTGNRGVANVGKGNHGVVNLGTCNRGVGNYGEHNLGVANLGRNNQGIANVGRGNTGLANVGENRHGVAGIAQPAGTAPQVRPAEASGCSGRVTARSEAARPATQVPPASLPRTGTDPRPFVLAGGALVGLGATLRWALRRRSGPRWD